jgi:DNA repair protein RadC
MNCNTWLVANCIAINPSSFKLISNSPTNNQPVTTRLFLSSNTTIMETSVAEIQVSYRPAIGAKPVIKSALDAFSILRAFYSPDTINLQEESWVLYLNRAGRVLGAFKASSGGLTGTVVDIRVIMGIALKVAATSIVLSHNHPSGNLVPSTQDLELTQKLKKCAALFDIKLIDHIILSQTAYYSFCDEGAL